MAAGSSPPSPAEGRPDRRRVLGFEQAVKKQWNSIGWKFTTVGTVASIIITLACLAAGVTGALSIAFGLAAVAVSLLLEALSKSYELQLSLEVVAETINQTGTSLADRITTLEANSARTANALEAYHDLNEVGDFRTDIGELLNTAALATKLSSALIRDTAIEILHATSDQLTSLRSSQLQLDASYSAKLIDAIKTARNTVQGTSPQSIDDEWWTLQLYEVYLREQKDLIETHGVTITRIFIADDPDGVYSYMKREEDIGIHTRFVNTRLLTRSGGQAYVIFDGSLLHRTIKGPDGQDENLFSENPADIAEFTRRFQNLHTLSKAFADLNVPGS